jgi:hypothetical protein
MRNGGARSRGTAYAYEPHEDSDSNTERRCKENGADKVMLFPVYERKIKVFKVRMVCNGKTQYGAGPTYSPMPTRTEMYLLFHVAATLDWECVHLDESRAFPSSEYKAEVPVVAMKRSVPMTNGQYIVKEDDLDELGEQGRVLNDDERREYQSLVGSMMWIGGLRHDISFSLNYLAGNGKNFLVNF